MKGFIYLLIFLILSLFIENLFKNWNIKEGLECAPKENSLSYQNEAAAKSQMNKINILKQQIKSLLPQIAKNKRTIEEHKIGIQKAVKSVQKGANDQTSRISAAVKF